MDLKEAYEILGVPETATREDVEKQYAVWARRDRARKRTQSSELHEDFDFGRINEAYKTITRHYLELEDQNKPKRDPRVEKLDHFWTYYKFHVFGAVLLIIIIAYIVNVVIDKQQEKERLAQLPPSSVSMMMFGEYIQPDLTKIEAMILSAKPDWQRVELGHTYVPSVIDDPYDYTSQQKAVITIITDRSDVYMIDRHNLQNLVNQGLFQPLDAYKDRLAAAVGEDNLIYLRKDPDGYDPDAPPGDLLLYTVRLPKKELYHANTEEVLVGIHVASENIENAIQLIEALAREP